MPRIDAGYIFNPDEINNCVIGIAVRIQHRESSYHQHQKGQLIFTQKGCMRLSMATSAHILLPSRLFWIPPSVFHRVQVTYSAEYRSVYLSQDLSKKLPAEPTSFYMNDFIKAVLEKFALSDWNTSWDDELGKAMLFVFFNELNNLPRSNIDWLIYPTDKRLLNLHTIKNLPTLKKLANNVGASEKTISRVLLKETGLSYAKWRQQWLKQRAIELLAQNYSTSEISDELRFSSDSAFVHLFTKLMGLPPSLYRKLNF